MVPFMSVTRLCVMASPSPVPPYFCEMELSACSKGLKSRFWKASLNPMPVSLTVKRISTPPVFASLADLKLDGAAFRL